MTNFRFNTICNITQELQELQRYNRACWFIGKSDVIKMSSVAITSYLVSLSFNLSQECYFFLTTCYGEWIMFMLLFLAFYNNRGISVLILNTENNSTYINEWISFLSAFAVNYAHFIKVPPMQGFYDISHVL